MSRILLFILFLIFCGSSFSQVALKSTIVESIQGAQIIDITCNGKYIAVITKDSNLNIGEISNNAIFKTLNTQNKPAAIAFSSDDETLFVGTVKGTIEIWNFIAGNLIKTIETNGGSVKMLTVGSSNKTVIAYATDNTIKVWNKESDQLIVSINGPDEMLKAIAINADDNLLAAGLNNGNIFLWELPGGRLVNTQSAEDKPINAIEFSPNGNYFALAGDMGSINLWNSYGYTLENSMLGHVGPVGCIAYSPDGKYIASGGSDGVVMLFEISTGKIVYYSTKHKYSISEIGFNSDGKELISASTQSDSISVWDVAPLAIKPRIIQSSGEANIQPKAKPEIVWESDKNVESISLSFSAKYKIRSAYPVESIDVIVNNEKQVTETPVKWNENQWLEFESIIYLKDGDNTVNIRLFYSDGMINSDTLKIKYQQAMAEKLLRESKKRTVVVYLRENDEYEYQVSGTEGYLYQSEKIKVDTIKKPDINIGLEPLKKDVAIVLNNITFASNSADLNSDSFTELDRVVELLKTNPRITIEISAHTDDIGSLGYNLLLSDKRAQSVVNYLLDNNIELKRLVSKGYGPKKPMVPNSSDENRALNRRVEFKIIEMNDKATENSQNN